MIPSYPNATGPNSCEQAAEASGVSDSSWPQSHHLPRIFSQIAFCGPEEEAQVDLAEDGTKGPRDPAHKCVTKLIAELALRSTE